YPRCKAKRFAFTERGRGWRREGVRGREGEGREGAPFLRQDAVISCPKRRKDAAIKGNWIGTGASSLPSPFFPRKGVFFLTLFLSPAISFKKGLHFLLKYDIM
nr:hypothetical protein [Ruminiclostridium sp.]